MPSNITLNSASAAGPIDAGPTVFTMRHVFEKLFDDVGESLGDHLTLTPAKILARHYWPDGSVLDLMANPDETAANIRTWGGARAEKHSRRLVAPICVRRGERRSLPSTGLFNPMVVTTRVSEWSLEIIFCGDILDRTLVLDI